MAFFFMPTCTAKKVSQFEDLRSVISLHTVPLPFRFKKKNDFVFQPEDARVTGGLSHLHLHLHFSQLPPSSFASQIAKSNSLLSPDTIKTTTAKCAKTTFQGGGGGGQKKAPISPSLL